LEWIKIITKYRVACSTNQQKGKWMDASANKNNFYVLAGRFTFAPALLFLIKKG
jgi:hypothetical protein